MKNLLSLLLIFSSTLFYCGGNDNDCEDPIGDELLTYEYFNDSSPSITEKPIDEKGNIFYENATATPVSNGIEISIPGVRIRTEDNNFEITMFNVDEKQNKETCFVNQFEFDIGQSVFKTDIASVLVLDMSTSLLENIDNLKEYAKEYANIVVNSSNNSVVAIVFFSDRDAIETTSFFSSSDVTQLNSLIDNFNNYQERTALFQATKEGIDLLEALDFDGEKTLVVFTDGGDNDSNNPTQLISAISSSNIERFAIGLDGMDFRKDNLKSILSPDRNPDIAENINTLQDVFRIVGRGVISVYELSYVRSDQLLTSGEKIEIRFSMETQKIE